jgi:putative heme iron utilization protein
MGDKKFSEEDVKNIFARTLENAPSTESHTRMISDVEYRHFVMDELYDKVIQSLQQTEWDVEVVMEKVDLSFGCYKIQQKFDSDGCLILKRTI